MLLSRGVVPHHFGLRVRVKRWAPRAIVVMMNGPAEGGGPLRNPLLNASGVAVTLLGSRKPLPANMPFHSAYGLANVMTACRSSAPRVTDATRSLPFGPAMRNALLAPFVALTCEDMSSQVIGVPSLQM